jgi:hypothetical protein
MKRLTSVILFLVFPLAAIGLIYLNSTMAPRYYTFEAADGTQYSAVLDTTIKEVRLQPGGKQVVAVRVRNNGRGIWIPNEQNDIVLSYRIFEIDDGELVLEGSRTRLPQAVNPGDQLDLTVELQSPDKPGSYILVIDMVHEGKAWFADMGSKPLKLDLLVTKQ